jgi:hypothetical protein
MDIVIGMGATISCGSDSYPATIIQITQNGKRIVLQEDKAVRTDKNGMSECQKYDYTEDSAGRIYIATLRKDGHYRITGTTQNVFVGQRRKHYDFSF